MNKVFLYSIGIAIIIGCSGGLTACSGEQSSGSVGKELWEWEDTPSPRESLPTELVQKPYLRISIVRSHDEVEVISAYVSDDSGFHRRTEGVIDEIVDGVPYDGLRNFLPRDGEYSDQPDSELLWNLEVGDAPNILIRTKARIILVRLPDDLALETADGTTITVDDVPAQIGSSELFLRKR